jgi:hypothetical protein
VATRPFLQSKYGKLLHQSIGSRKPTVGTMGESHGIDGCMNAIALACHRYYHADIVFDHRSYANGGTVFAIGGTSVDGTNGLTTQATWFATRPTDIVFIASGYNDQPTNLTAPTIAGTVQTVAEQCFTAGAQVVVICGITQNNTTSVDSVAGQETYNTLMQNWTKSRPGAIFLDLTSVMTSFTAGSGVSAYRQIGNVQGSMTADGTHWSQYLCLLLAPHFANVFRGIAPERIPRTNLNAGQYNGANRPWINLLGDVGNCLGTAGFYGASPDSGVAGTGSASRLIITPVGGVISTNSIVTGTLGERKQRMVLSGTTNSSLQVQVIPTITNVNNSDTTRRFDYECVIDLTTVTGLSGVYIIPVNSAYISPSHNNDATALWPDSTTAQLLVYSLYSFPISGDNPSFYVIFNFFKAPTGTIEISRMSAMRVV